MKRRRWSWLSRPSAWPISLISYFESENHLPHPIACREGCSFCCFNQVEVTPLEALRIGHYVGQNFSTEEKDALMAKVTRSLRLKAGKSQKQLARLRHQFPCPLLMGGRCSIYPVRPLVCRAMHTFEAGACEQELLGESSARVSFMPTVMSLSGPSVPDCKTAAGSWAVKPAFWT